MAYDLGNLPLGTLFAATTEATATVVRYDERLGRSVVGEGCRSRADFIDACASLWIEGELVHLEDLVLHDANMATRAPSHELTIAHDVLRTRRRIYAHPPGWALSIEGIRQLRGRPGNPEGFAPVPVEEDTLLKPEAAVEGEIDQDPLARELAAIDAVLISSSAALSGIYQPVPPRPTIVEKSELVYEQDWDEDERLEEWRAVLIETENLPAVLRAVIILDAWNQLQVLQHASWLGRLLAAAMLRKSGITTAHLLSFNVGLKSIARERRASRDRDTRILVLLEAIKEAAENGLKEHDRLLLARQHMQHRLTGRRQNSKLPQLIDLILSKPMVSSSMISKELGVTVQGALKIASELNLRELTGRGRFRAWGVV